jgi:protoporphyrinogen oxidase
VKIAVIGAGPAGITAAYELSKAIPEGKVTQLDLYEISSGVGGLSRSIRLWDQIVDLGPHRFFSQDTRVNKLWLEVVEDNYDIVNRQTRIFYKKSFFDYPLKPGNALRGLGLFEAARCVLSYMWQRMFPTKDDGTFESWVTQRFGKRLYQIFFKTYSEKLWGIPCDQLDSDFASQRIKKLSLFEAIKNALFQGNNNQHKTLVDQFAYPLKGTGWVYERMAEIIRENGGNVLLNSGVEKVHTSGRKVTSITLTNGEIIEYDHVISSMPISLLVRNLSETPNDIREMANSLKFRNTMLVYLKIDRQDVFSDQWLYIHSKEMKTGRITNFRNWLPELYGDEKNSILCLEYWANFEDPEWKMEDDELIKTAKEDIVKAGFAKEQEIVEGNVIRLPRCYPVYFKDYKKILKPVENYLGSIENLHVIGRYGAYKYNNQDHSIIMGLFAAENILHNKNHNLWEINTDYEVYQEASIITKTGLTLKN